MKRFVCGTRRARDDEARRDRKRFANGADGARLVATAVGRLATGLTMTTDIDTVV